MGSLKLWGIALGLVAASASGAALVAHWGGEVSTPTNAQSSSRAPLSAPDRFYPGFDPTKDALPAPRKGGRVVVHMEAMPSKLNYFLDNSGMTRRIAQETHEALVERDFETLRIEPVLAESFVVEDTLVLADGTRVHGKVSDQGDAWLVTPLSSPEPLLEEPRTLPKKEVARVDLATVYTFKLRPNVKWHDGHPLRVEDFLFTWRLTKNQEVECGQQRFQFDPISRAEKLDERTLRFFYDRQYFISLVAFEALAPLPAHLYDLRDPENKDFKPEASDHELARYVNQHRCNREGWIGLGPYRITAVTNEYVEARRFDDYFDPAHGGWFDEIRWRVVPDPSVAFRALLDGELDFTASLSADDYFGSANDERFTEGFYRGFYYTPRMSYVAWNLRRPQFQDARTRNALALAFDWDGFIASYYGGLAERVTAEWFDGGPNYDHALAPIPFDLRRARELLRESGWYDRDGDGWVDKDGKRFEINLMLLPAKSSEAMAQRFQDNLKQIGVKLEVTPLDWSAMNERAQRREFDALYKAWVMPIESDPEQLWHSRQVGPNTGNETSFSDPEADRLIDALQRELDPTKRGVLFQELQRVLYRAQAYMYGVKVPVKFAMSRRIRNFKISPIDPGYRIRDWYFADAPERGR